MSVQRTMRSPVCVCGGGGGGKLVSVCVFGVIVVLFPVVWPSVTVVLFEVISLFVEFVDLLTVETATRF